MSTPSSGQYNLSELILTMSDGKKYDLFPQLDQLFFRESFGKANVEGVVAFVDNTNAFGRIDFDGLETVNMTLNSLGTDDPEISFKFRVYATDLSTYDDGTKQLISLSLVTPEHYPGSLKEVKNGFVGMTVTDMVKQIYDEHIASNVENAKPLEAHQTTNSLNIVIPQLSPNGAMNFLARKAFRQGEFQTSTYTFHEDRDQFNFKNLEEIISEARENVITFDYVPNASFGGRTCEQSETDIIDLKLSSNKDYLKDLKSGLHITETKEIDILGRNYIEKTFKSTDIYEGTKSVDKDSRYPDTTEFLDKFATEDIPVSMTIFTSANFSGITDFAINYIGPKVYMGRSIDQVNATMTIYGNTKIKPGMMINLNIPKPDANDENDELAYLAGNYLVTSVAHTVDSEVYLNTLGLKKDSYKNNNTESDKEVISKTDEGNMGAVA